MACLKQCSAVYVKTTHKYNFRDYTYFETLKITTFLIFFFFLLLFLTLSISIVSIVWMCLFLHYLLGSSDKQLAN